MRKLYIFNNSPGNTDWNVCHSMADDGTHLGSHVCSHEHFMQYDLHDRKDRLETILHHFNGEPYELELMSADDVLSHAGLKEALRLNELQGQQAAKDKQPSIELEISE